MSRSASMRVGAIAALYLLWFAAWLVLGPTVFGPAHHNWDQTLAAAAATAAAFTASRHVPRPYPVFLLMIGAGLAALVVSWFTYGADGDRFTGHGQIDYSDVAYSLFVFIWICAWGYLALDLRRLRPVSALTGVVFVTLIAGLAIILAAFYYPQYRSSIGTAAGRLDAVTSGLEFIALIAGLACILLGEQRVVTWMVIATAILLAGDMAYSETVVPPAIQAVWMLGQALMLCALVVLPGSLASAESATVSAAARAAASPAQRSALSGILILLSIGCVLLSATLGLIPIHPVWKSFLSILFVVALMVGMVWLTDRFDDAVDYLSRYSASLLQRPLDAGDWRQDAGPRLRATLQSTGLGAYLDALSGASGRLKGDVLFLGPERLYPPPKAGAEEAIRCFIVMPFGSEWSNEVHRTLADACRAAFVQPVRGDDLFTPTDILVDIWHSINGADFMIADITGRNANVLYELGIAHTLAKPVLIVSRSAADIPIDLGTRRVILYGQPDGNTAVALDDLGAKVSRAIAEIVAMYRLRASPGGAQPIIQSASTPVQGNSV
jgi:hypothetical protein